MWRKQVENKRKTTCGEGKKQVEKRGEENPERRIELSAQQASRRGEKNNEWRKKQHVENK